MRVILVHGYLATRHVLWPLARGLRRLGYEAEVYGYASHRGRLEEHAAGLIDLLRAAETPLALVGHSLGGLLIHTALHAVPEAPVVRRVFIATPHRGCRSAKRALSSPIARLVSEAGRRAAFGCEPRAHASPVGVIVGTRDRTVFADEAELPGAHDHLALPFTHNELVIRPQTAHAVDRFLRYGRFEAPLDLRQSFREG